MKQIRLEHFRCYENLKIDFRPGINLLIGDNASGKTTVLKACRYVLSSFFAGYSDENTRWQGAVNDDFTVRIENESIMPEKAVEIYFVPNPCQYEPVSSGGVNWHPGSQGEEYVLKMTSKKNRRPLVSGIKEYRDYAKCLMMSDKALPLFASFSTEDIHAIRKLEGEKFKSYLQKASFGYYECLDGDGFFPFWLKRLLVLQEGQVKLQEIEAVRSAIINALGPEGCGIIQDMIVRPNQGKVYYLFEDGREVDAAHLSDGYRRLVNIVTDLAFRCSLLNDRIYGKDAVCLTKGTVLIDEIDMHLHPTLQARVLKGLRRAFPNLQFVVTTHAPMVMTSVDNDNSNVVYHLSYADGKYGIEEVYTYGMDSSTITDAVLNQTPREQDVDNRLKELFDLIDNGEDDKARDLLDVMRERFGDKLPELSEAEAMLDFSIGEDYEEDK